MKRSSEKKHPDQQGAWMGECGGPEAAHVLPMLRELSTMRSGYGGLMEAVRVTAMAMAMAAGASHRRSEEHTF